MSEAPASRFEFVTIASARAKQLLDGCTAKIEGSDKPARRALQEVSAGAVRRVEPDAQGAERGVGAPRATEPGGVQGAPPQR